MRVRTQTHTCCSKYTSPLHTDSFRQQKDWRDDTVMSCLTLRLKLLLLSVPHCLIFHTGYLSKSRIKKRIRTFLNRPFLSNLSFICIYRMKIDLTDLFKCEATCSLKANKTDHCDLFFQVTRVANHLNVAPSTVTQPASQTPLTEPSPAKLSSVPGP